ncbi:uncharacterized protein DS421_12g360290 [Arachis hypogaea]|nr:uncharacterized protein DS421_12g360290 [Arachis hypogaea]
MALLNRISVAPSQLHLHLNSWASIRCFEMVCEYLELPVSVDVFLFFFNLTNPSKEGKATKGFMSFRSAQGRMIFGLFEDSYHGFKDKYFKVRLVKGRHPFWLSLEGERLIPTYWNFGAGSNTFIKVTYKGMSAVDRNVADVLLAVFGRNHVNPHLLMGVREVARNYILEMSASVTGLEGLFKTFLADSDEEKADEKANGKPENPHEDKKDQAETAGSGHSSSTQQEDDDLKLIPTPKRQRASSSPEGVLTVMERNFDTGAFIDSQLLPGTEDHFLGTKLAGQARWMYRTLLRGAAIARKAEFELSRMQSLRRKLDSAAKANNEFKTQVEMLREQLSKTGEKLKAAEEKAASAEEKLKTSDATVSRLTEREMTLESQLNAAQGWVVALEKERDVAVSSAKAAQAEVEELRKKHKEIVKQGKSAILMTEEALKAQVKIVAPNFDTSAIGVFKTIKDGKIVDMPKMLVARVRYRYVGNSAKPGRGFAIAVAVCYGFNLVGSRGGSRNFLAIELLQLVVAFANYLFDPVGAFPV